jgi:RHS repeat-associated protein
VGLRPAAYTNNLLNQIMFRDVPGSNDITGIAHASANVAVNGQSVYRKGEFFWKELLATNSGAVAWQPVTNQAALAGQTNTQVGNLLTARRVQQFWHDADGNLLSDGVWTNTWDAENRLISTESAAGVPTGAKAKETWSYYADGRWNERVIYSWNGSAYVPQATNRFVWDANVILAILDHSNGLVQAFMRGLDLPGSMQGAGGAGGLLAVHSALNSQPPTHFYAFDGNGNVAALVSATNGTETARYEYGPFGELLRATGPLARINPFRFSTKYQDDETDLVMYPRRPYSPSTGRWLCKDPIGERGGLNLYGFVGNDPIRRIDPFGLDYYVYIVKGTCGVNHRVLVGDDGNGNTYEIDIQPLAKKWYQEYRRVCGKGVITYTPRTGPATNWISGKLEKHESTTPAQDAAMAAKAKSMDNASITYCLGIQDCRAIEDCLLWGPIGQRISDQLQLLWDVIMEQVSPPK